jgi:hypothetical protein
MRTDPLSEAASRRHELTRARAIQALHELDRAGVPVTFAGVARATGLPAVVALHPARHQQPDPAAAAASRRRRLRRRRPGRSAGHRRVAARQPHRSP